MEKTRTLTVSDLLATLPKNARVLGFKFHRQDGLLSGKVEAYLHGRFETFFQSDDGTNEGIIDSLIDYFIYDLDDKDFINKISSIQLLWEVKKLCQAITECGKGMAHE